MKKDWTYKRLVEVADIAAGQGAPQGDDKYCADGIPFVKAGNLEYLINGGDEQNIQKVSSLVATSHRLKLYPKGSVIFAKSGMSCMKGYVYELKNNCYVVSHLAIVSPFNINSKFLTFCLNYYRPNSLVKDTAYPSISLSDIANFTIPVPPISIQESIVRELDAIHGILEKKQEQLRELDNLAQAIFYEMFGELDNYDLDTLANLYKFIDYRGKTPNKIEQGIPLVTARNVRCGYMDYTVKDYISAVEYTERQSRGIARKGDILFTTEAPLGYAALADLAEFSTGQRIIALQLQDSKKVNNIFVLRYILSTEFQQLLLQNATGATAQGIKAEKLKKLSIPLPPLSLQQSFAAKIEAIEAQKQAVRQSIREVEALLAERMDNYFS